MFLASKLVQFHHSITHQQLLSAYHPQKSRIALPALPSASAWSVCKPILAERLQTKLLFHHFVRIAFSVLHNNAQRICPRKQLPGFNALEAIVLDADKTSL